MNSKKKIALGLAIILLLIIIYLTCFKQSGFYTLDKSHKSLQQWSIDNNISEILEKPLSNFYINSSHNSYISGTQIGGAASATNVKKVLDSGARCIELDIHVLNKTLISKITNFGYSLISKISPSMKPLITETNNLSKDDPIITHGNKTLTDINTESLDNVLKVIKENAFSKTNDPLIVYLEIFDSDNEQYMIKIRDMFNLYLGNMIYEYRLDNLINNYDKYYLKVPIKELLNKIIIVINYYGMENTYFRDKYLYPIANGCTNESDTGLYNKESYPLIKGIDARTKDLKKLPNQLTRIYPYNEFFSSNYDPKPFWAEGHNMVSLNFSNGDSNLKLNINKFKYCSFIPQNIVIDDNGKKL